MKHIATRDIHGRELTMKLDVAREDVIAVEFSVDGKFEVYGHFTIKDNKLNVYFPHPKGNYIDRSWDLRVAP